MNQLTNVLCRRNVRAYISAFITYLMLAGQAAPLAFAAGPRAAAAPPARSAAPAKAVNAARRAPAPLFAAPNITATKIDSWDDSATPDGKAEPGQVITYTVKIENTGDADATGVTFTDTVDPNTTLDTNSITTQPIARADSYNVIGNVRIQVPDGASDLLGNDCDPDPAGGPCTNAGLTITTLAGDSTAPFAGTSAQGGNVTATIGDGSFQYNPAPGFTGTDTFTYTVTDGTGKTDTATVTLKVGDGAGTPGSNVIWFVNSAAATNGDGRLTSPFNCLRGPGCFDSTTTGGAADDPGDTIFLYASATSYSGGLTLLNNQLLIGQGASGTLAGDAGYTVPSFSDALPTLNNNPTSPTITTTLPATNGVNIATGASNTLRGFTVGNTTGAKIASPASPPAAAFGTLTVSEVILNGNGQALNLDNGTLAATFVSISSASSLGQGIALDQIAGSLTSTNGTTVTDPLTQCILVSGSTAAMSFGNTSCSDATDGISLQNNSSGTRTFGTLTVSGTNTGSAFLHAAGGGNVTVTGAAGFVSALNPVDIQNAGAATINFSGGATVTKTTAGGAGVNLVASSITFESLGITTSNGPGLSATTSGTVTVTNNSKAISATGSAAQAAPAIIASGVTLNANFSSVTSTNSGNTTNGKGVSLTNVSGTSNFGTGSITGASDVSFFASGGNGSVTYNGTMTQTTAARVIDVQSKNGGTFAFGGAITSNNGTGRGVFLNSNTGATFNFTGGLTLSTATNDAFTATGGGTVSATQNNTSIVNTLTTTTGQALKVTSTTIGGSGLTFRSITSNGGANNGVTLDTTGSGAFTVTGNGTAASGGTIQNKTGADGSSSTQGTGIYLNAVSGAVSLTRMDIEGCQNYGIRGITLSGGLTIDNTTVGTTTKNGTTFVVDADADTGIQGESSLRFTNLTGTAAFSNDSFDRGQSRTLLVHNNTAGSTLTLNITNSTLNQTLNSGNGGDANSTDAIDLQANSSATMNVNLSGSHFTSYRQFAMTADGRDAATINIDIGTCDFSNTNSGLVNAGGALNFGGSGSPSNDVLVKYNVHNNTFRHGSAASTPTNGGAQITSGGISGGVKFEGKILNNTFGVSGVASSGAGNGADVLRLFATGNNSSSTRVTGSTHTRYLVQGNTIQRYGEAGIQFNARQGNSTIDATVLGNIIREPGSAAQGAFAAIWVNSGALGADTNQVNIGIGSATVAADKNTMQDSDPSNATDVFLDDKTCAGCASSINLYQNGSDAAGATTEAKASDVLKDDNNPTLDLLAGFTNSSTIGFIAGLPPQPTAASPLPPTGRNREVLTPPSTGAANTATQTGGVTSTAFVSPRQTSPTTVALVPRTTTKATAPAEAPTLNTTAPSTAGRTTESGALTPVIDGAGGTVSVNIGTLPAGDSVTITFQVTVDSVYTGGPNVSNQGTVSGSNFPNVLTDDPDIAGANNPTLTPINSTKIQVNDAKQPEPAAGTGQMVFTVTLSSPAPVGGLTVSYATANGGATPATGGASCDGTSDYVTTSGTLGIAAGSQTGTIPVTICADAASETDETLLMNISSPSAGNIIDGQAVGTITANTPGQILVSEFRTRGPAGAGDDFVELYNNNSAPHSVLSSDGSAGYGVFKMGASCSDTPVLVGTIPNGTTIPGRGHYLFVGSTYSLANYGGTGATPGDQTLTSDIEDDRDIAIFSTANVLNISSANRLDGVGFNDKSGAVCELMREGTGLAPVGAMNIEYSYFRNECDYTTGTICQTGGFPKDSNDNASDFLFADTAMTSISGIKSRLGAPGPEEKGSTPATASPIRRDDAGVTIAMLDGTKSQSAVPNRERDAVAAPNGTLFIRRRIENTTGATITRMRFRVVEITTGPTPPVGTADLRAITSTPATIGGIMDSVTCSQTSTPPSGPPCTVIAQATVLEETVPGVQQPNGGGYNSSLTVSIPGGVPNNGAVDVNFALRVVQGGTFRFYIIVEALP
jgi:hypothetical protein